MIELQREIDESIITVGYFNTIAETGKSNSQKFSKDTLSQQHQLPGYNTHLQTTLNSIITAIKWTEYIPIDLIQKQ